mmetsp:Transcript_53346/g.95748  ORF Transcript_53346/g.95748 Transcript_53346/m.95748 type:complete len:218 (+) Transcript_53346:498-1151(+)
MDSSGVLLLEDHISSEPSWPAGSRRFSSRYVRRDLLAWRISAESTVHCLRLHISQLELPQHHSLSLPGECRSFCCSHLLGSSQGRERQTRLAQRQSWADDFAEDLRLHLSLEEPSDLVAFPDKYCFWLWLGVFEWCFQSVCGRTLGWSRPSRSLRSHDCTVSCSFKPSLQQTWHKLWERLATGIGLCGHGGRGGNRKHELHWMGLLDCGGLHHMGLR